MTGDDKVSKLMSKTVRTADADDTLLDALNLMVKHDIGSIVVLSGGKPYGILTERDIVKRLGKEGPGALDKKVGKMASRPLVTASPDSEAWEAFALMLRKGIRRLPVMDGNRLSGIVTERDLLKWVVKVTYEPNIPEEIKRLIAQNP